MRRTRHLMPLASLLVALCLAFAAAVPAHAASLVPSVEVQTSQDGVGLRAPVLDGGSSGGDGIGRPIRTLKLTLDGVDVPGDLLFQVYQKGAWSTPASSGLTLGTGDVPIQAVRMSLIGEVAEHFQLAYRADVAGIGWLAWTSNNADAGAPGLAAIDAIQVKLMPRGAVLPDAEGMATIDPAGLSYFGHRADTGWDGPVSTGSVGTGGVALLDFKAELTGANRPDGTIRYAVFADGRWQPTVEDGREACAPNENAPIEGVRISLDGTVSRLYDVWYRVYVRDHGWLGCVRNGADAGSSNAGLAAEAVQLWLLPKGSAAPESTENPFIDRFRSGDPELDGIVDTIIDRVTGRGEDALRRAYDYVATYPYYTRDIYPAGDWSPLFAKQMYYNHGGNCYRYAALFREIARGLGYRARVVSGSVPTVSDPAAAHGWCEIQLADGIYIYDPDMQHAYPTRNFYQRTYDHAPLTYSIIARGPW